MLRLTFIVSEDQVLYLFATGTGSLQNSFRICIHLWSLVVLPEPPWMCRFDFGFACLTSSSLSRHSQGGLVTWAWQSTWSRQRTVSTWRPSRTSWWQTSNPSPAASTKASTWPSSTQPAVTVKWRRWRRNQVASRTAPKKRWATASRLNETPRCWKTWGLFS